MFIQPPARLFPPSGLFLPMRDLKFPVPEHKKPLTIAHAFGIIDYVDLRRNCRERRKSTTDAETRKKAPLCGTSCPENTEGLFFYRVFAVVTVDIALITGEMFDFIYNY